MGLKLYSYWRSTTSLRVRAVLNLKGFDYEIAPVNLLTGAQSGPAFSAINPSQSVPVLVLEDGTALSQSLAIIDYLDVLRPNPPLLHSDPLHRAQERAAAYAIAMDIHPVNNLKVLNYLRGPMDQPESEVIRYVHYWMHHGLEAFQRKIRTDTAFAFGERIGLADICLVSQLVNARRWAFDLTPFDRLCDIDARALSNPLIAAAMPENQPDAA